MRNHRQLRRLAGWPLLLTGFALSGCMGLRPFADRAPLPGTPRYMREMAARQGKGSPTFGRVSDPRMPNALRQHDNGPGIVVCEPVAAGAPRPVRDFGAGCSRWLHYQVAGHVEFGKTPIWDNFNDALVWAEQKGHVMTLDQAATLARTIGATHAAVGQIGGDEKRCRLKYQLYQIPAKQPVGPALTAEGTREQVLAQLPQMARRLTTELGVAQPRVAERVAETASDLQFVGSLPRPIFTPLASDQAVRLERLARTSTLGAMFYTIDGMNFGADQVRQRAEQLVALAGDHPVAWGALGLCLLNSSVRQSGELAGKLDAAVKQSPQNYQLTMARAMMTEAAAQWGPARNQSEEAARCATANPIAWLMLAQCLSNEAQAIRQGRAAGSINSVEWTQLKKLYPHWQAAAQKIVDLDPTMGDWWVELAVAATFAGDTEVADRALWTGISRGVTGTRAYTWGLEIYQPKWYPDAAKLRKVAEVAAARTFDNSRDRLQMARSLFHHNFRNAKGPLHAQVLRTAEERAEFEAWARGHQATVNARAQAEKPVITRPHRRVDALRSAQAPPPLPYVKAIASHNGGIAALVPSPDGQTIAAGGGDGRISLVSPAGDLKGTLVGHRRYVRALAWSPDGRRLASGGSDGSIRIWDPATGAQLRLLRGHQGRVLSLAWPAADRILSGGDDAILREWNAETGEPARTVPGLGGELTAMALSPDRSLVAVSTGAPAYANSLWEVGSLKKLHELSRPTGITPALAWSADGTQLATGGRGCIHLWAPRTGELARTIDLSYDSPLTLTWSGDGKQIFFVGSDRIFHLLDVAGGKDALTLSDSSREVLHHVWDAGGQRLISGGSDGNLLRWDLQGQLKPPAKPRYASR